MGLGIGLTMSPMSTAAMNAVQVTKAGVASGHPLDEPHGRRHLRRRRRRARSSSASATTGSIERLGDLPLSSQQQAWFADNLGSGAVEREAEAARPADRPAGRPGAEARLRALPLDLAEALDRRRRVGRRDRAADARAAARAQPTPASRPRAVAEPTDPDGRRSIAFGRPAGQRPWRSTSPASPTGGNPTWHRQM